MYRRSAHECHLRLNIRDDPLDEDDDRLPESWTVLSAMFADVQELTTKYT